MPKARQVKRFELRAGYARPLEVFEPTDEVGFRERWMLCYNVRDAGAWQVFEDESRFGTREPGRLRASRPGETLNVCAECQKDFFAETVEHVCFACCIVLRPTEYTNARGQVIRTGGERRVMYGDEPLPEQERETSQAREAIRLKRLKESGC